MSRPVVLPSTQDYLKQAGRASRKRAGRYNIEGELVTYAQIAARIGCSETAAGTRLKREQQGDGPVTWAGLAK